MSARTPPVDIEAVLLERLGRLEEQMALADDDGNVNWYRELLAESVVVHSRLADLRAGRQ
jgi:hypothetical protein